MSKLSRSLRWASAIPVVGALAMLLASCAIPTTPGTITGRVYNADTGAGLSGATISIGSYTATTNSSGDYTIALASGATSASGNLAVTDGAGYDFIYEQGATVTTTGGSGTFNMPLVPSSSTVASTPVTLTGKASYLNGTALSNGDTVELTIFNPNGSQYSTGTVNYNGTSYSVLVPALGTNCFVVVKVTPSSGTSETYYMNNVSLASSGTLNLKPSASSATTVTLSGSGAASVTALLNVPGIGSVPIATTTLSSGSGTISVYDPDGYSVMWGQQLQTSPSSTSAAIQYAFAAPVALASKVTLSSFTESIPATYPDMSSATYANGTISFTPPTDSMGTLLQLQSSTVDGFVWATSGSVTLPASIQSLISGATGWKTQAYGVNISVSDPTPLIEVAGNFAPSEAFQSSASANTSTTAPSSMNPSFP